MDSPHQIPTLVVTGPVGVGKTTVAASASDLLGLAGMAHALVDADWLRWCHPSPDHDPFHVALGIRNLASVWQNYRAAGAERLVLVDIVETNDDLQAYRSAVPGADIVVARLRAPVTTLVRRLEDRETEPTSLEWHRRRAPELARIMESNDVGDLLLDTDGRAVMDLARELLSRAGWVVPEAHP